MKEDDVRQIAYVGLGSNLGDRERYLDEAVMLLEQHHGVRVTGKSSIYETDPVGFVDQRPFLNRVIEVETALSPEALFEVMLAAEQSLGRKREVRWGPRTIDLDMLLFDEREQDRPDLILPHPRMLERSFVLVPLIEVMSGRQPGKAEALKRQLDRAEGKEGVTLWKRTTL